MDMNANQETATETSLPVRLVMPFAALLALLTASCCVLPIGLSIIGLGGSWLTMLGPFIAYRGFILAVVALALVWAWYRVLRPKSCAMPKRSAIIWTTVATVAFFAALSSPLWEGSAQRFMWDLWRSTS
jgi:mercuric ion transport protein